MKLFKEVTNIACGEISFQNFKPNQILPINQQHSKVILDSQNYSSTLVADGIIFPLIEKQDIPFAIKTADCIPLVFISSSHIALVHAGWRGLKNGIIGELFQIHSQFTEVFILPHIKSCCFEVTKEFYDHFPREILTESDGRITCHLENEARRQLKLLSPNMSVINSPHCTHCHTDLHSYRANKTPLRNWTIFTLKR